MKHDFQAQQTRIEFDIKMQFKHQQNKLLIQQLLYLKNYEVQVLDGLCHLDEYTGSGPDGNSHTLYKTVQTVCVPLTNIFTNRSRKVYLPNYESRLISFQFLKMVIKPKLSIVDQLVKLVYSDIQQHPGKNCI